MEYITPFLYLLNTMAPYLLLGFLLAGVIHAYVPRRLYACLLYTSPSPRDRTRSRMPSSA